MQERRRRQRFFFQQPVTLTFGDWCQIQGIVENAGEMGVLLISSSELAEGIPVEVTIDMPRDIQVSAPGSVARVERCPDGQIAIAVNCHRPFSESANPNFILRGACLRHQGIEATEEQLGIQPDWPLGQIIIFKSLTGLKTGVLREVRWGLVWRELILADGRVIPEHKVLGRPEPPVWRKPDEVSQEEREMWEEHLISMAEAGLDPRDREQPFWAELNQYAAYIYLKKRDAGYGIL